MKINITKIFYSAILFFLATFNTYSQPSVGTGALPTGNSYQTILIPLPTSFLSNTVTAAAGGSTITNFYAGWTNITSVTNIQGSLYTNNLNGTGNAGFYTQTNVINYTNVIYPYVFFPKQERLALEYRGISSGGSNAPCIFTFAKSVTGRNGQVDTSQQFTWTVPINQGVGTNTVAVTNLPADFVGGQGYLYLIQQAWGGTNVGAGNLTNLDGGIYAGIKPNAP